MPIYSIPPELPGGRHHGNLHSPIGIGPRGNSVFFCNSYVDNGNDTYTAPKSSFVSTRNSGMYDPRTGDLVLFRVEHDDDSSLLIGYIFSINPIGGAITFVKLAEISTSGFSPSIEASDITGGHRVTVTNSGGSSTFDVMDGEKGDPFEFEDFTEEQLAELREDVASVYTSKDEAIVTTVGTNTTSITIPFADWSGSKDMLLVYVEGLALTEGVDYAISGSSINLTSPITHEGTDVTFKRMTTIALSPSDFGDLVDNITNRVETLITSGDLDATTSTSGTMSAADKAKLDGISLEYVRTFDTVADMQADDDLQAGMTCHTNGFYSAGDGGAAYYIISASGMANGMDVLACVSDLYATLVLTNGGASPKQYGAYGDGIHDDTEAIQQCLDKNHHVVISDGTYLVDTRYYSTNSWHYDNDVLRGCGLNPQSNTLIEMSNNVVIQETTNTSGWYHMFQLLNVDCVTIRGGKIVGEKSTPTTTPHGSEFGYGIFTYNATNILIENVEFYNHWGDGICFGGTYPQGTSKNLTVRDCHIHDCRRQGISITDGSNYLIENCHIHDIEGTAPQSCIDIEGVAGYSIDNIKLINCIFENGDRKCLSLSTGSENVLIDGCKITKLQVPADLNSLDKKITVVNSTISGLVGLVVGDCSFSNCTIGYVGFTFNTVKATFENCVFNGCNGNVSLSEKGAVVSFLTGADPQLIDVTFKECVFDPPDTMDDGETVPRDIFTSTASVTNPDAFINLAIIDCLVKSNGRRYFWGTSLRLVKVTILNSKFIVNNAAGNASNFFSEARYLVIKNSEFVFESAISWFAICDTTDPIYFVFSDNEVKTTSITGFLRNGSSTGFSSAVYPVINNNIFRNAIGTAFTTMSQANDTGYVTVIGGNNYGIPTS